MKETMKYFLKLNPHRNNDISYVNQSQSMFQMSLFCLKCPAIRTTFKMGIMTSSSSSWVGRIGRLLVISLTGISKIFISENVIFLTKCFMQIFTHFWLTAVFLNLVSFPWSHITTNVWAWLRDSNGKWPDELCKQPHHCTQKKHPSVGPKKAP